MPPEVSDGFLEGDSTLELDARRTFIAQRFDFVERGPERTEGFLGQDERTRADRFRCEGNSKNAAFEEIGKKPVALARVDDLPRLGERAPNRPVRMAGVERTNPRDGIKELWKRHRRLSRAEDAAHTFAIRRWFRFHTAPPTLPGLLEVCASAFLPRAIISDCSTLSV